MKNRKKLVFTLLLVSLVLTVVSCTAGPNGSVNIPNSEEYLAGFFMGIWHGMILFFTFIISLFNENVSVYEVHNVGALYNLGYLIGVSIAFGGSGRAGKKSKKRWNNNNFKKLNNM